MGRFYGGGTPSKENLGFWDGNIPWVSPKDMKSLEISDAEDHITHEAVGQSATRVVPAGSLLIVVRSGILQRTIPVGINSRPVALNQDLKAFVPGRDVESRFLMFYVLGEEHRLLSEWRREGATVESLDMELVQDSVVCIPPVAKQRGIAAYLDRKTSPIDALIAKKGRLIELLQEKRQALIAQAVTKGLDPDVPLRTVPTPWFDRVPAHWKLTVVKRTAAPTANAFTDGDWIEAPFVTDSGIRLLQTGNVGIGRFKEQGFRYVSESTFRDLRCTEVHPGNVLICRLDGPVGRACLAPDLGCRMITSVDNAILRPSREFDAGFLVYALSSQLYLDWVGALCRVGGGHRFRISRSMLGEFEVPAPPLAEQQEIRSFLDRTCKRTDVVISRVGRHVELLREYRQALISAAVTGKIEIPAEEAA